MYNHADCFRATGLHDAEIENSEGLHTDAEEEFQWYMYTFVNIFLS